MSFPPPDTESLANKVNRARLYGILDLGYVTPANAVSMARTLLAGGVGVLQLRAKGCAGGLIREIGQQILPLARAAGVPFLINDHVGIAAEIDADGVHLGQNDGGLAEARARLRPGSLVGRSTHSLGQARAAHAERADYIGFGPLFPTPTKPGRPAIGLADVREATALPLPVFVIGGVNAETLPAVMNAGARRVVVVSAMLRSADPEAAARSILETIPELH